MRLKLILTIITTAPLFWSCGEKTTNNNTDNYDVTKILKNVADNIIIPQYADLKESTNELNSQLNNFKNDNSNTNLLALQNQHKEAYTYWQNCSFVNFGNINIQTLGSSLNTYPTDTANIHKAFKELDPNLESATYSDAIGFPGLDYVLFEGDETKQIDRLSNEAATYLSKNINLINSKSISAYDYWKNNTDEYYSNFVSTNSKAAGSAFSELINGYIQDVELLKNGQVGFPAGKFTLNTPQPKQAEALFGKYNIDLLKAHLSNLKRVYKGEDLYGNDREGFDDYLKYLKTTRSGKDLNELILGVFDDLETKTSQLTGDINTAIANQTELVDEIYAKTKELVAYLKVDMVTAFGVQITYIDNDGD